MNIVKILKDIELPEIYIREGKECYYDTYRKKLIEITPEETVRQKIAAMFEHEYGVPPEMMMLEVPMSHYVKGAKGRADIIIHIVDEENNCMCPVAIIECKNKDVHLTDGVVEQAIRYCDTLGGKYIAITNGIEITFAVYDEGKDCYIMIEDILSYKQMVNKDYIIPELKNEKLVRFSLEELNNQKLLHEYNDAGEWIFGEDSDNNIRSLAVNLYQAFLDTEHKLPVIKRNSFELIEDIGERYMDYSNAGGGHYVGTYRAFLVKDRFGEPQIVSMSLFGTDPNFRGEKRKSYTSLTVAIDRFKSSHNSLQYNLDRFIEWSPTFKASFKHNGQISSMKSSAVIEKVSLNGDGLEIDLQGINLGEISANKVLYLDDKDVSELIYNLIEYALLRDELRRQNKTAK